MKKIIYTLAILVLISSCKSIDKMVESGNYDQALRYGVDKLRGEKNKKTKYVKGLEKAYEKLNHQDQSDINHLKLSGNKNSYDRIVDIYSNMEKRQEYVLPLLPLISEDGYLANIKVVDYSKLINTASLAASERQYSIGLKHLKTARETGSKKEARNAYAQFENAQYYFPDYKDTYELKNETYNLGQSRILVEPYTQGSNMAFDHTFDIISQINIGRLNSKWQKFYVEDNGTTIYNYIATIEVIDIIPGTERERERSFTETKQIKHGRMPIKDRSGNMIRDTSGNIQYTDKYKTVTAHVTEIEREKIAHMNGRLVIVDALNNSHINSIPINVTHEFTDYSCNFRGDKRALTDQSFKRVKPNCDPFPTDYEITSSLAYTYKSSAESKLKKQYFSR